MEILEKPDYSFPSLINPHADTIKKLTTRWIQQKYIFLGDSMKAKYILSDFGYITARCLPHIKDLDRLIPCARFMLWGTVLDDYYEHYSCSQLQQL